MSTFLLLIFEFFKTGLFAIGGGLATIPFLQDMAVKYNWFTTEMLTTMIAISESTPGPMGINMATYVGYHMFGLPGAIATSLALVAPSIIVICIIANMLTKFKQNQTVQDVFYGLRPAVVSLILVACIDIFLITLFNQKFDSIFNLFNMKSVFLLGALIVVNQFKKLHPILIIVTCALTGILFAF
ncbi:chromate transporter [Anaerorhabdus furcosa]|uniref:Chromate transporter n=1 Tax=Anaerorhabdus furcosa TaxID=118967 RepID=A0A1T4K709_9FIRM|nr:chromate transporter [Anaerorhabdus furcosa]SJZ38214.1 chromate transporter [Anaerorhabdus furcosa]